MIYESGQVRRFFPYVADDVEVFLLGGPADGDEAQTFHEEFPAVKIIGVEPNRGFYAEQVHRGFPGVLLPDALWSEAGVTMPFYLMGDRHGRSSRLRVEDPQNHRVEYEVTTRTIDDVLREYAPDAPAAVWIDIERAEIFALRGATDTLVRGLLRAVYLEAFDETIGEIQDFLGQHGLREAARVNQHELTDDAGTLRYNRFDVIFVKER